MDRFKGSAEFDRLLDDTRRDVIAQAEIDCKKSADQLAGRVKRAVPLGDPRGGHIRSSVVVIKQDTADYKVTIGGDGQPYAAALEFGHKAPDGTRVPPQKVFFPSVTRTNKTHRARIIRNFKKIVRGAK